MHTITNRRTRKDRRKADRRKGDRRSHQKTKHERLRLRLLRYVQEINKLLNKIKHPRAQHKQQITKDTAAHEESQARAIALATTLPLSLPPQDIKIIWSHHKKNTLKPWHLYRINQPRLQNIPTNRLS